MLAMIIGATLISVVVLIVVLSNLKDEHKDPPSKPFKGVDDTEEMKNKFAEAEKRAHDSFLQQEAIIQKNREKQELERKLDMEEKESSLRNQTSVPQRESMEIDLSSPNNIVHCISPMGNVLICSIENSKTERSESFSLDNKQEVKDLLEMIFDCWAAQEVDKYFYPFASFPFKQYRNTYVKVVGMKYRDEEAIQKLTLLGPGAMLVMVPERSNPHDEEAIRVFTADGYHVGYVSMNDSYKVKEFSDGIVIGWMSTSWVKGKQSFSVAIVDNKYRSDQLKP